VGAGTVEGEEHMTDQQQFNALVQSFLAPPKQLSTSEQNALADIAKLIWPFPTQLPPAKPSKPIPFNPENYEDAPF
jgi:hypothetical protein